MASPLFYFRREPGEERRQGSVRFDDGRPSGRLTRFGYLMGKLENGEWRVSRV